jgi:hypothetical protein
MHIEKLGKIGIGVGIAVGIMMLFMLGLSVPDQIGRFIQDYDMSRFEENPSELQTVNAEFLMEKFSQTEDYSIFVQRNTEYVEDLELYRDGGHLRLTAFNTTTNNVLELRLSWDNDDFIKMDKDAYCRIGNNLDRAEITARESAVAYFLKSTDCVN